MVRGRKLYSDNKRLLEFFSWEKKKYPSLWLRYIVSLLFFEKLFLPLIWSPITNNFLFSACFLENSGRCSDFSRLSRYFTVLLSLSSPSTSFPAFHPLLLCPPTQPLFWSLFSLYSVWFAAASNAFVLYFVAQFIIRRWFTRLPAPHWMNRAAGCIDYNKELCAFPQLVTVDGMWGLCFLDRLRYFSPTHFSSLDLTTPPFPGFFEIISRLFSTHILNTVVGWMSHFRQPHSAFQVLALD